MFDLDQPPVLKDQADGPVSDPVRNCMDPFDLLVGERMSASGFLGHRFAHSLLTGSSWSLII